MKSEEAIKKGIIVMEEPRQLFPIDPYVDIPDDEERIKLRQDNLDKKQGLADSMYKKHVEQFGKNAYTPEEFSLTAGGVVPNA